MGLCKKALTLLRSAFKSLPDKNSRQIFNQVIAWILNLIQGDSVNAAGNRADIVQEGLEYLVEWIQLASEYKELSIETLAVFEQSIFESCSRAREFKPREAITAIYECASVYFESDCASDELISQCRSYIALALRTPIDTDSDFQSLLKLIRIYSSKNFDQVEIILADNETNSWNAMKVLPVLCAISCSQRWNLLKNKIVDELGSTISSSTEISYLICYVQMMEKCKKDPQLFHQQFEVFESVLYKTDCNEPVSVSYLMQSISLLLSEDDHQKFMNQTTTRYQSLEGSSLDNFNQKYRLAYLQNKNTNDLKTIANLKLPERTIRQLFFAICNREAENENNSEIPEQHHIAEIKAKLLRNAPNSLSAFEQFLTNISGSTESPFEYLLDFDSFDSNPDRCRYETASPLWRQRIFCQIVPIFKRKFEEPGSQKHVLVEMLPHLLTFAVPLDFQQLKKQFAMLLPVLIQTIGMEDVIPSHVTRTIPMFLTISEPLQPKDLGTVVKYLCSITRDNDSNMTNLEDALNGLNILARRQPPKSLHSEVPLVVTSINKILGHKKRLLRMMAADVKNNWEMVITK